MEPQRPKKLLDQVRDAIRRTQSSRRTEETDGERIHRDMLFHHIRHHREMGVLDIEVPTVLRVPTVLQVPKVLQVLQVLQALYELQVIIFPSWVTMR